MELSLLYAIKKMKPNSTYCAPLLADIFSYSYEAEFVQKLLQDKNKGLGLSFNPTYRYIDDVLSINNRNFHNIYPDELKIKDIAESDTSASYPEFYLVMESGQFFIITVQDAIIYHLLIVY
jgi:hypothetical protein